MDAGLAGTITRIGIALRRVPGEIWKRIPYNLRPFGTWLLGVGAGIAAAFAGMAWLPRLTYKFTARLVAPPWCDVLILGGITVITLLWAVLASWQRRVVLRNGKQWFPLKDAVVLVGVAGSITPTGRVALRLSFRNLSPFPLAVRSATITRLTCPRLSRGNVVEPHRPLVGYGGRVEPFQGLTMLVHGHLSYQQWPPDAAFGLGLPLTFGAGAAGSGLPDMILSHAGDAAEERVPIHFPTADALEFCAIVVGEDDLPCGHTPTARKVAK